MAGCGYQFELSQSTERCSKEIWSVEIPVIPRNRFEKLAFLKVARNKMAFTRDSFVPNQINSSYLDH